VILQVFESSITHAILEALHLELEKIRKNPQYPWRWKEITLFTLKP